MDKAPFEWRAKLLSAGGVLFVTALSVLIARQDYSWLLWRVGIVGLALMAVAVIAIFLDRRSFSVKARLLAPWQQLKRVRVRSPLTVVKVEPEAKPAKEKSTEAMFAEYWSVAEYGNPIFNALPTLTSFDQDFLQDTMEKLRPVVDELGRSVNALLSRLIDDLGRLPMEDPRYWVGWFINANFRLRAEKVVKRFDKQVEKGVDSREAFAGFHFYFVQESPRWVLRMLTFLGKKAEDYDEFRQWKVRHDQYVKAVWKVWDSPQFEPLKAWMQTPKLNGPWDH